MPVKKNELGNVYGKLTVIGEGPVNKFRRYTWQCVCECGHVRFAEGKRLRNGTVKSCGQPKCSGMALPQGEGCFRTVLRTYKKHAETRGLSFRITDNHARKLFESPCYYCAAELSNYQPVRAKLKTDMGGYSYNGIDRLDNKKGYTVKNCVPCCKACNKAKDTMTPDDFIQLAHAIAKRHPLK